MSSHMPMCMRTYACMYVDVFIYMHVSSEMVQDIGLSANTGECKDLGRFDVHTAVERKWRLYSP